MRLTWPMEWRAIARKLAPTGAVLAGCPYNPGRARIRAPCGVLPSPFALSYGRERGSGRRASPDSVIVEKRAVSSAVEHYLDMVGVTGSNPVPPTTRRVVPEQAREFPLALDRGSVFSLPCPRGRRGPVVWMQGTWNGIDFRSAAAGARARLVMQRFSSWRWLR